jgi:hypothetical protein
VCFFEMGQNVYMLMASRKHIEIFRGEMVWTGSLQLFYVS